MSGLKAVGLGLQPVLLALEPAEPAFVVAFDEFVEEEGAFEAFFEGEGGTLTGEAGA